MIQMRSWLTVADNSGARQITCILPLGGDAGSRAGLGDVITEAVKKAAADSAVKKGSVVKPGRVMFEMAGVDLATAQEAMQLAAHKLPIRTRFVSRAGAL